jgi:hypothetical protein
MAREVNKVEDYIPTLGAERFAHVLRSWREECGWSQNDIKEWSKAVAIEGPNSISGPLPDSKWSKAENLHKKNYEPNPFFFQALALLNRDVANGFSDIKDRELRMNLQGAKNGRATPNTPITDNKGNLWEGFHFFGVLVDEILPPEKWKLITSQDANKRSNSYRDLFEQELEANQLPKRQIFEAIKKELTKQKVPVKLIQKILNVITDQENFTSEDVKNLNKHVKNLPLGVGTLGNPFDVIKTAA